MAHPLFGPEIRLMLDEHNAEGLRAFCESLHPATVAEAFSDEFNPEQVWEVISHAAIRTQAAIFEYLPPTRQEEMLGKARPQVGQLIGKMSHDDRVDLLRRVPAKIADALIRVVDEADRKDIATLFQYGENTVGALMTTDYAWLPGTLTAAEAIDQLRQQAPDRETIYYIYVLDEPNRRSDGTLSPRRLLGVASLRDLILVPRHSLIRDVMESKVVALRFDEDQEAVTKVFSRYDFLAIPVVDDRFGLLGIVTHDDVLDVVATGSDRRLAASGCGRAYRRRLPSRQFLSCLAEPSDLAGSAIRCRTCHLYGDGLLRGTDCGSGGSGSLRTTVHFHRRQFGHASGYTRHSGDGARFHQPARLEARLETRTVNGAGTREYPGDYCIRSRCPYSDFDSQRAENGGTALHDYPTA